MSGTEEHLKKKKILGLYCKIKPRKNRKGTSQHRGQKWVQ